MTYSETIAEYSVYYWDDLNRRERILNRRAFSSLQKEAGYSRAGMQCEYLEGDSRCQNKAVHADRFFPYSKGGGN
jgi:hypothetical protein